MFLEHFKSLFNDTTRDVRDDREDQDADHYDNNNEDLNKAFEEWEILKALRNLKSNKACGHDQIINEFLKASTGKMTEIYMKLFNLIPFSGKTPNEWSIGMMKPIYKQKGSCDDPNNYRGITILSCFGKLFTSVINNRLVEYFDENATIVPEQAGFRAGHSTVDQVFTLHCIIDFFLAKKKRLCCLFIDYEKAFDRVESVFLWQKLLDSGVDGHILTVIMDMYRKAKSCVKTGNVCSNYFLLLFRRSPGGKFVTCTFCHLSKWPARVYGREIWRIT